MPRPWSRGRRRPAASEARSRRRSRCGLPSVISGDHGGASSSEVSSPDGSAGAAVAELPAERPSSGPPVGVRPSVEAIVRLTRLASGEPRERGTHRGSLGSRFSVLQGSRFAGFARRTACATLPAVGAWMPRRRSVARTGDGHAAEPQGRRRGAPAKDQQRLICDRAECAERAEGFASPLCGVAVTRTTYGARTVRRLPRRGAQTRGLLRGLHRSRSDPSGTPPHPQARRHA